MDDDIRSAQGAGSTEVGCCENAESVRVQTTPKSFRVEHERERNSPNNVKRLENCADQDRSKSSPAVPDTLGRCASGGGCGENSVLRGCY